MKTSSIRFNNKYLSIIVLLIISCITFSFISQSSSDEDMVFIKKIYNKINLSSNIEGKTLYCKIGVISSTNIPKRGTLPEQLIEVYINKNQSKYISSEMIIFEDDKDAFTIITKEKTILWRNSVRKTSSETNGRKIGVLQDTLLSNLRTINTTEIVENKQNLKRIETKVLESEQAKYNIKNIIFYVDKKHQSIAKLEIKYLVPVNSLLSVKYTFYDMDFDYKSKDMEVSSVKSLIFSSGTRLNDTYKGYTIKDIREQKKR